MITMHARPRRTDGRTDEHHGNSETIRSSERIAHSKNYFGYTLVILLTLQAIHSVFLSVSLVSLFFIIITKTVRTLSSACQQSKQLKCILIIEIF